MTTSQKNNSNTKENLSNLNFIRPSNLSKIYGVSRSTIFRMIDRGQLPEPTRVTTRVIGWDRAVLDDIFLK